MVYLQETNLNVCQWLMAFMRENPITLTGSWEVRAVHGLEVQAGVQHAGLGFRPGFSTRAAYWGWACDALRCRARDAGVGLPRGVRACKRLGLSRMALKSRCAVCA